jgi:hypothetical protein
MHQCAMIVNQERNFRPEMASWPDMALWIGEMAFRPEIYFWPEMSFCQILSQENCITLILL